MLHLTASPTQILRLMNRQFTSTGIHLPPHHPQVRSLLVFLAGKDARIVENPITYRVRCHHLHELGSRQNMAETLSGKDNRLDVGRNVLLAEDRLHALGKEKHHYPGYYKISL